MKFRKKLIIFEMKNTRASGKANDLNTNGYVLSF